MDAVTLAGMLSNAKLLIFDFDGTLANTSGIHARAFEAAMAAHGVPVDYPSIAGMKTIDAVSCCLQGAGIVLEPDRIKQLAKTKQQLARAEIAEGLTALPGADAFLDWARKHHRLALCTSGSRLTVELALRMLGYSDMFEPIVCSEDVQRAKPDPEGFLRVLDLTGFAVYEALVFEDSPSGVSAAKRAGIPVICVDPANADESGCGWNDLLLAVHA